MATVNTTTGTYLTNLFDPQVVADLINKKLVNNMVFAPLAKVDYTLQGRAGDTVTLPYYSYIGKATQVAEGTDIPLARLTQTTTPVQIVKFARACQLTDEAVLSGYGDPLGEATTQLAMSINDAADDALLAALAGNTVNVYTTTGGADLAPSDIPLALAKYGEDIDGTKVLLVTPNFYAKLLSENWIPASEIAAEVRVRGVVGMSYGCQVIVSNRLVSAGDMYIVKPGALAMFLKRDTMIEFDRDVLNQSTVIAASKMCAPYLLDPTKAIKLSA